MGYVNSLEGIPIEHGGYSSLFVYARHAMPGASFGHGGAPMEGWKVNGEAGCGCRWEEGIRRDNKWKKCRISELELEKKHIYNITCLA